MKKLLMAVVTAFIAFSANAQKLDFGIKGGVNFANASDIKFTGGLNESYKQTADGVTGYHFGVWAEIGSSSISFQPELLYSRKGFKATDEIGQESNVQLNYLDIPLLAKIKPLPMLHIVAGPQVSIKLADKITGPSDFTDALNQESFKNGDWGAILGAGVSLSNFQIDARYVWGLSKVTSDNLEFKNQMFQISLAYKLF
ncbi:PorT family protein [Solitalea sp. MAHUQ-68]|uniref:PorT family protein n=1 Tax=Solitalea agri TaxID=2953739 RepID=A0A9X2JDZ4_9SPHI|nr:porin family protein [Solitalea agri]MCO4293410.1 PorT family protein [Solitalea agri]